MLRHFTPIHPTEPDTHAELTTQNTRLIGATTAGIRAVMYQVTTLYLRTPAKLFRPARVDYMALTRLMVHGPKETRNHKGYIWSRDSSLGVLISAVRKFGWRFIPDRVLPPLIANSATGVVLYTTYLTSLQWLNDNKTNFLQDPSPWDTARAGFLAGMFQSLAAAPIDAIYARSNANELLNGGGENLWRFGWEKLRQIGFSGVFAGYSLSLVKESISFAIYFSTFETMKNQCYYLARDSLIGYYFQKERIMTLDFNLDHGEFHAKCRNEPRFKYLKTTFVFLAGVMASLGLHLVQYPISKIQNIHLQRLEAFDYFNRSNMTVYYNTYIDTMEHILFIQHNSKLTWKQWLYSGFTRHAMSTIPATTLGLVVLELLRNKLADEDTFE